MNAAAHYQAAELAIDALNRCEPHEFMAQCAEAISHGLLAVVGAIMLRGMHDFYPNAHGELSNAVVRS